MRKDEMEICERIVGLWSIDVLFGPSVMEDTWIAFRGDGTGWIAYLNADVCDVDTFIWKVTGEDKINISGQTFRSANETCESNFSFSNLGIQFYEETTPVWGKLSVVEFDQDIWCRERRFGLVSRKAADLQEPAFA